MKKITIITFLLLFGTFLCTSFASQTITLYEEQFFRDTQKPVTQTDTFIGLTGKGKLIVKNGNEAGKNRISSAEIIINNNLVIGPDKFNQKVGYIEIPVNLLDDNTISVTLKSKPGSFVAIQVTQEVNADAAKIIGSQGGVVEVTNPDSPVYGAKIEVPEGALQNNVALTIRSILENTLPMLPTGTSPIGQLELGPDGLQFNKPVTITMPLGQMYSPDTLIPILFFDSVENQYSLEAKGIVTEAGNMVEAQINHFSQYVAVEQQADQSEQNKLKDEIIAVLTPFFKKYEGRCFYEKGFINIGDIEKAKQRLYDSDVQIFIYPDFLNSRGASAMYYNFCMGWPICPQFFFNDIILADRPSNIDPVTLWHELMHAIFDKNDDLLHGDLLAKVGIKNDEEITWLMEQTSYIGWVDNSLLPIEQYLEKVKEGELYDNHSIQLKLDIFVNAVNEYKQNPGNICCGGSEVPPITQDAIDLVKTLTGFYISNPEDIRKWYLDGNWMTDPCIKISTTTGLIPDTGQTKC